MTLPLPHFKHPRQGIMLTGVVMVISQFQLPLHISPQNLEKFFEFGKKK